MGGHRPLRRARGAGGEYDVRQSIGLQGIQPGIDGGRRTGIARHAEAVVDRAGGAQRGQVERPEQLCEPYAQELLDRQQQDRAAGRQDVCGLSALEAGVEGNEHCACGLDSERGQDPPGAVRGP